MSAPVDVVADVLTATYVRCDSARLRAWTEAVAQIVVYQLEKDGWILVKEAELIPTDVT